MPFSNEINAMLQALLAWLAVPQQGLIALAIVAFVAASIVPLSSEAMLVTTLAAQPQQFWWVIFVATVANTLGSLTTYWFGRLGNQALPQSPRLARAKAWFDRYGEYSLLLAWLPLIGDVLVVIAGLTRVPIDRAALWIGLGKAARYLAIAAGWVAWA